MKLTPILALVYPFHSTFYSQIHYLSLSILATQTFTFSLYPTNNMLGFPRAWTELATIIFMCFVDISIVLLLIETIKFFTWGILHFILAPRFKENLCRALQRAHGGHVHITEPRVKEHHWQIHLYLGQRAITEQTTNPNHRILLQDIITWP